jgi:hypothetical protein
MAEVGVDNIIVHFGNSSGGTIGSKTVLGHDAALDQAAATAVEPIKSTVCFRKPSRRMLRRSLPRGRPPRSRRSLAKRKLSSTRMTRASGTRKPPVAETARTPSSRTQIKPVSARASACRAVTCPTNRG